MKKSTRAILIIAIAVFIVGGILTSIGFALGGSWYNWPTVGRFTRFAGSPWSWGWGNSSYHNSYNYGNNYSSGIYPTLYSEASELPAFTQVSIDTRIGRIDIRHGDDYHIDFEDCPMDYISYEVQDGRLRVTDQTRYRMDDNRYRNTRITITIPENSGLERLAVDHSLGDLYVYVPVVGSLIDIDLDLGDLYLEGGHVRVCEIDLSLGSAEIKNLVANSADFDLSLGGLTANNVIAGKLKAELSMGSVKLTNVAAQTFNVKSNMGSIDLRVLGDPSDYNYVLKASMGSATFDGERLRGGTTQQTVSGRPYQISGQVDMGDITVTFSPAPGDIFAALGGDDIVVGDGTVDALSGDIDDADDDFDPDNEDDLIDADLI